MFHRRWLYIHHKHEVWWNHLTLIDTIVATTSVCWVIWQFSNEAGGDGDEAQVLQEEEDHGGEALGVEEKGVGEEEEEDER